MRDWPDLVGKTKEEAQAKIQEDCPNVKVQIVPEDSMVSMDFVEDRVRIFVTADGKVAKTPRTG